MATVTSLHAKEVVADPQADPVSVARVELQAAKERRAAADSALAEIRKAEKQSSRGRWAAKAAVEKLSKSDDNDAGALDQLIADLAIGKIIDISAPIRDRAAALDKARADVAQWETLGVSLRAKAAAAQEEIHWSGVALERAIARVMAAIGAELLPDLLRERAVLLKNLAAVDGIVSAFRGRVDGDARAMLEASDREADLADKAGDRIAPQWLEFAERLLLDAYAPLPDFAPPPNA